MIKKWLPLVVVLLAIWVALPAIQSKVRPLIISKQKSFSRIDDNVPRLKNFNRILKRDLTTFIKTKYTEDALQIEYEMLQDFPIQSGESYPTYCAWVTVISDLKQIDEGAVRVAAIERTHFEITDYLRRSELTDKDISAIFPASVCEKIKEKL